MTTAVPAGPVVDAAPAYDPTARLTAVRSSVATVVRGQAAAVELVLVAALSGNHVLLEDAPGSGKSTLARAVATATGMTVSRVQGTADLLPGDITGSMVWHPGRGEFEFVPGPVFASLLLVDEMNRIPPRTHSALLEAMEERRVTVDGRSHTLPEPFVVIGTQNPHEQHGAYPLPESTLDRFAVRLELAPLPPAAELDVVVGELTGAAAAERTVLAPGEFVALVATARSTYVGRPVAEYAVSLVRGTRTHPEVRVGASARASVALVRCAQARALVHGSRFVRPDDVAALAVPVLAHRLQLAAGARADRDAATVTAEVVARTPVPVP